MERERWRERERDEERERERLRDGKRDEAQERAEGWEGGEYGGRQKWRRENVIVSLCFCVMSECLCSGNIKLLSSVIIWVLVTFHMAEMESQMTTTSKGRQ